MEISVPPVQSINHHPCAMIRPMKTRIPQTWSALFAGDQIHTKLAYHRMLSIQEVMAPLGFRLKFTPAGAGYIVECLESPLRVNIGDAA